MWLKRIDKTDYILMGLYFSLAFIINFFAEWSEEDVPLFTTEHFPLIKHLVIEHVFIIITIIIVVYGVFNSYFPKEKYLLTFLLTIVVLFSVTALQLILFPKMYSSESSYLSDMLWGVMDNFQAILPLGLFLTARQFYSAKATISQLEKSQKESELKLLEAQVDPHFLFNNLNILNLLIETDPKRAQKFTQSLSSLYRYLIKHKNEDLVPAKEELTFTTNYIFLLKQRFENLFEFNIDIKDAEIRDYFLPPATMQTLIENVVKHNAALQVRHCLSRSF